MRLTIFVAGIAAVACMAPNASSAQSVNLSLEARQQLLVLTQQLVQLLNELSQAQALGPSYTSSAAFSQQSTVWVNRIRDIQSGMVALISTGVSYTTPVSGGCPALYRDILPGFVGDDVGALQRFLSSNGSARYSGSANNLYDTATVVAVQRFQSAYGIVNSGDPSTTGYGKVGPATRAAIARLCAGSIPTTPIPVPPSTAQGSGSVTVERQSGLSERTLAFAVRANPTDGCTARTFTLAFGDGTSQLVTFPATCSSQTQTIQHTYPSVGSYTVTLTSGSFQMSTIVSTQASNYSLTLSASAGSASKTVVLTATYYPGSRCEDGSYDIEWGDGDDRTITFNGSCSTITKTYEHTYDETGTYTIRADDNYGSQSRSITYTANALPSAGAGDPSTVLNLRFEGTNGSSSMSDSSPRGRSVSVNGNTHITTSKSAEGSGSAYFDGSGDYLSISDSSDFDFASSPFTVSLWFAASTFPATNQQAALLMQANSSATDNSLGGGGLILFGNKVAFVGTIGGTTYHPFYNNTITSSALTAGQWYHVALVRSGNTVTLYVNGVAQGSKTVSGSANNSSGSLAIGRYGDYSGNYFDGWIDDVNIAKGTARWTANFDPATASSGGGSGSTYEWNGVARRARLDVNNIEAGFSSVQIATNSFGGSKKSHTYFYFAQTPANGTWNVTAVYGGVARTGTFTIQNGTVTTNNLSVFNGLGGMGGDTYVDQGMIAMPAYDGGPTLTALSISQN